MTLIQKIGVKLGMENNQPQLMWYISKSNKFSEEHFIISYMRDRFNRWEDRIWSIK